MAMQNFLFVMPKLCGVSFTVAYDGLEHEHHQSQSHRIQNMHKLDDALALGWGKERGKSFFESKLNNSLTQE